MTGAEFLFVFACGFVVGLIARYALVAWWRACDDDLTHDSYRQGLE